MWYSLLSRAEKDHLQQKPALTSSTVKSPKDVVTALLLLNWFISFLPIRVCLSRLFFFPSFPRSLSSSFFLSSSSSQHYLKDLVGLKKAQLCRKCEGSLVQNKCMNLTHPTHDTQGGLGRGVNGHENVCVCVCLCRQSDSGWYPGQLLYRYTARIIQIVPSVFVPRPTGNQSRSTWRSQPLDGNIRSHRVTFQPVVFTSVTSDKLLKM